MDKNKISSIVFYFSILTFIIAFNFQHNPPSGWYQQFMPNIGNRTISDIVFLDSLKGWAVTSFTQLNDTVYVLKTTNGGDNWFSNYTGTGQFVGMKRIFFLNDFTGYACGNGLNNSSQNNFAKTTNGGSNWFNINPPDAFLVYDDMSILNEDTIWLAAQSFPAGGVFRTTNGGTNWTLQFSSNFNPDKIYMFNRNIGFISVNNNSLLKTTNSGESWTGISGAGNFLDIYFADSLIGWKVNYNKQSVTMQKTINGGLNWINQVLPQGGYILTSQILNFDNVNRDTIWGVGGRVFYGAGQGRGIVYRTTNGGSNWLYQIPDTSIHIGSYSFTEFNNKFIGWCYSSGGGIHTKVGGDTIFTKIKQTNNNIPGIFTLYQNYPNPFNPKTVISYQLTVSSFIVMKVYDVLGNEVKILVNKKQSATGGAGNYKIEFDGTGLPSGIYFYSLFIDGEKVDTKKMVLVR